MATAESLMKMPIVLPKELLLANGGSVIQIKPLSQKELRVLVTSRLPY